MFDIANQLLTRHSPLAPLGLVDEWTAKPSPFSIQGRLSKFFGPWPLKHWKIRIVHRQRRLNFLRMGRKLKYVQKKQKLRIQWLWQWYFSRLSTKIDSWKICHRPILAVYLKKISSVGKDQVNNWEFCVSKITPIVCFCSVSTLFSSCQRQRTLRFLFGDCRSFYFRSLMKLTFLVGKGLLCLYDKQNNTWLLVDTKFLFSYSTRHLTRSLRSLVSSRVKHSKRNFISTRAYVLFSIYRLSWCCKLVTVKSF